MDVEIFIFMSVFCTYVYLYKFLLGILLLYKTTEQTYRGFLRNDPNLP